MFNSFIHSFVCSHYTFNDEYYYSMLLQFGSSLIRVGFIGWSNNALQNHIQQLNDFVAAFFSLFLETMFFDDDFFSSLTNGVGVGVHANACLSNGN